MALPSSPPLLPMGMEMEMHVDDPPSSPPLPALAVPPSRKRQLSEFENLSSDPLFSEGTADSEDAAGYDRPRRKRMVRGPWWSMGKRPQRDGSALKDIDSRNVDSGIWMGSDGSDSASLLSSQRKLQALRVSPTANSSRNMIAQSDTTTPKASIVSVGKVRQVEQVARRIIEDCVEDGKEAVDLSRLDLQTLSSETLRPLHQLIRHAHISSTLPPSEDQFIALTPELKLFLAGNQLVELPAELFLLENMTVLSLRNNLLQELPHSIGRLSLLRELNIAGNQIRYLPFELLGLLGSNKQINIRPNPLIELKGLSSPSKASDTADQDDDEGLESTHLQEIPLSARLDAHLKLGRSLRAHHLEERRIAGDEAPQAREELIYLASSNTRYFDVVGMPCRRADDSYEIVLDQAASTSASSSKSPSLFEIVLQCAQRDCDLDGLPTDVPAAVYAALDKAARDVDAGNQHCTTCNRGFIIPRAEWIEFWFSGPATQATLTQGAVLPFMRKACSWACAEPTVVGGFR